MLNPKLPNWKLCGISPPFCPCTRIIPKSPVSFGMCWRLSASKRGKNHWIQKYTQTTQDHDNQNGTRLSNSRWKNWSRIPPRSHLKCPTGSSGKSEDSQVIQKHRLEEKCATHFPGNLHPVQFQIPAPCWVLGDSGEAAAANFPSATLNLKETPKKPLVKESLGMKKNISSYSLKKTQLLTKCPRASTTVTAPSGQ